MESEARQEGKLASVKRTRSVYRFLFFVRFRIADFGAAVFTIARFAGLSDDDSTFAGLAGVLAEPATSLGGSVGCCFGVSRFPRPDFAAAWPGIKP